MPKIKTLKSSALRVINIQLVTALGGKVGARKPGVLHDLCGDAWTLAEDAQCDVAQLAAFYLCSIVELRPFLSANLRTAWSAARHVLDMNGCEIFVPDPMQSLRILRGVQRGECSIAEVAGYFRYLERIAKKLKEEHAAEEAKKLKKSA